MRWLFILVSCMAAAAAVAADKPVHETQEPLRVPCGLVDVVHDWDFALGPQGFTTGPCDTEGVPVWEHGSTTFIPGAPGDVWGTILQGNYPIDAGEALVTPAFAVDASTTLMEIHHFYSAENLWDGGNVKVNGQVLVPLGGYPGVINVAGSWYAWCVDFQSGFTGLNSGWLTSCFDLSAYLGQTIQVSFEFGSDDTVVEAGWYIASVKVGNDNPVPIEHRTWNGVKGLYR